MNEKYNTNINSIEEAIKQLEDLKKDRLGFVTGDAEHDNIFLRDVQAIEIVLGNLEALADMQKSADKKIKELDKKNDELLKDLYSANCIISDLTDSIPTQKIKDKIEELNRKEQELQNSITEEEREEYSDANISFQLCDIEIRREVLQELLQEREE